LALLVDRRPLPVGLMRPSGFKRVIRFTTFTGEPAFVHVSGRKPVTAHLHPLFASIPPALVSSFHDLARLSVLIVTGLNLANSGNSDQAFDLVAVSRAQIVRKCGMEWKRDVRVDRKTSRAIEIDHRHFGLSVTCGRVMIRRGISPASIASVAPITRWCGPSIRSMPSRAGRKTGRTQAIPLRPLPLKFRVLSDNAFQSCASSLVRQVGEVWRNFGRHAAVRACTSTRLGFCRGHSLILADVAADHCGGLGRFFFASCRGLL